MATGKARPRDRGAPRSSPRVREAPAPYAAPRVAYVESSALVAAMLESDRSVLRPLEGVDRTVTSALTWAEAARAVVRARATGRIDARTEAALVRDLEVYARRCEVIGVSEDVLTRAGRPFPVEPIRTLDAIHLATLALIGDAPQLVQVVTRDERVAANARALGYSVL